jgi:hypothetical protein
MKKLKKVKLSAKDLDTNLEAINSFLDQKKLSLIQGGYQDWGNTNYCESTHVRHP